MGQTRGVTVTYLCAESGIERGIEGTLSAKRAVRMAALDPTSNVDSVETPSFNTMLRQVREILEGIPSAENESSVVEVMEEPPGTSAGAVAASPLAQVLSDPSSEPRVVPSSSEHGVSPAHERLRLARVVLEAGFPADAVRAAYDALAKATIALLDRAPPPGHTALIAAVYRDLLPVGRMPAGAHAALATLHDLGSLDLHGVAVDAGIAAQAVSDAEAWVARLAGRVSETNGAVKLAGNRASRAATS